MTLAFAKEGYFENTRASTSSVTSGPRSPQNILKSSVMGKRVVTKETTGRLSGHSRRLLSSQTLSAARRKSRLCLRPSHPRFGDGYISQTSFLFLLLSFAGPKYLRGWEQLQEHPPYVLLLPLHPMQHSIVDNRQPGYFYVTGAYVPLEHHNRRVAAVGEEWRILFRPPL